MHIQDKKRISLLTPSLTWNSRRSKLHVSPAGKPPKLRFRPGQFVKIEGEGLHEVLYAFRVEQSPYEWLFCLEERKSFRSVEKDDEIGQALAEIGCGSTTPRIVYELFRSAMDAESFFSDIPAGGCRVTLTTKQMLARAQLMSSGEVLETTSALREDRR